MHAYVHQTCAYEVWYIRRKGTEIQPLIDIGSGGGWEMGLELATDSAPDLDATAVLATAILLLLLWHLLLLLMLIMTIQFFFFILLFIYWTSWFQSL